MPSRPVGPGKEKEANRLGTSTGLSGVAVDQATGNVYVLNVPSETEGGGIREHHLIEVFTPTGDPGRRRLRRPGRAGPAPAEGIAEGPGKLHAQSFSEEDGIAVDEAGTVYVIDRDFGTAPAPQQARVMSFEPEEAGEYEHYVYAGQGKDILAEDSAGPFRRIALVGSNRLVTASRKQIREYPTGGGETPLCTRSVSGGEAVGMAANSLTGEVFYFAEGKSSKLRRLGPCNEATHEFAELQTAWTPSPATTELLALAVNPSLAWGPLRPAGVLYGADAEDPTTPKGIGDVFAPAQGSGQALTVSRGGSGSGTVTSSPAGIDCGSTCSAGFPEGETVTLTATATAGSSFSGWSGECASTSGNECEVTMSAARSVTATFEEEGGGPTEYPLTTHVTGEGTIECAPPGGDCGAGHEYLAGTTVTLTPVADEGWEFLEWTGACVGTLLPACEVTIEEATDVGAVFGEVPTPEHTLSVSVSGEGEVSADVGTISGCTSAGGSSCEGSYGEGATVTLTETAAEGSHFLAWGTPQCDESSEPTCEVTIGSGDEGVAASFEPNSVSGPPLTVAIEEGEGTVVSSPAGIECTGAAPKSCETESIEEGTVTLTASAAPGYAFKNWRHCDKKSGEFGINGRQCVIDLSEAKEVGANFTAVDSLTLSKASGSGAGQLNTKPGGIACPYNCQSATASFKHGSQVTVVEKPAKHFHFVEFTNGSGSASSCDGSTGETCSITISAASSIEAKFAADAKHALSLAKQGGGQALIKTKGPGIVCSYACSSASASFYEGEVVEVKWKLAKGTSSLEWGTGSGTCTGTETEAEGACTVTMSAARQLSAQLE